MTLITSPKYMLRVNTTLLQNGTNFHLSIFFPNFCASVFVYFFQLSINEFHTYFVNSRAYFLSIFDTDVPFQSNSMTNSMEQNYTP